jgi:hypothetical protein
VEGGVPVRGDDGVAQGIDAFALWLVLDLWDAGAVLLFLELATHRDGLGWKGGGGGDMSEEFELGRLKFSRSDIF